MTDEERAERETRAAELAALTDKEAVRMAAKLLPALSALGWVASRRQRRPVDAQGEPVAWYTYPALSFLSERTRLDMRVFEFGAGYSTMWWANQVERVHAVEHHLGWFEEMAEVLPENVRLDHVELK